jgi:hypothetical protein
MDLFLVISTDIDIALSWFAAAFFSIGFLRLVRLLRLLRLVNRFRRLRMLIVKVGQSFASILNVIVIFFWCLSAVGLSGMQIFQCNVRPKVINNTCTKSDFPDASDHSAQRENSEYLGGGNSSVVAGYLEGRNTYVCPIFSSVCNHHVNCPLFRNCAFDVQLNFNSFWRSTTTSMVMLMDSSWTDLLYRGMRSYPSPGPAVVFFVVTYCVFMYGLFIFFIAILLVTPFTPYHVHTHPTPCSLQKKR